MQIVCNICQHTEFVPKLGERPASDGRPRRCLGCGAQDRQRIVHRYGVEFERSAPSIAYSLFHLLSEIPKMIIAWLSLDPRVRYPDNGFVEIFIRKADGA